MSWGTWALQSTVTYSTVQYRQSAPLPEAELEGTVLLLCLPGKGRGLALTYRDNQFGRWFSVPFGSHAHTPPGARPAAPTRHDTTRQQASAPAALHCTALQSTVRYSTAKNRVLRRLLEKHARPRMGSALAYSTHPRSDARWNGCARASSWLSKREANLAWPSYRPGRQGRHGPIDRVHCTGTVRSP